MFFLKKSTGNVPEVLYPYIITPYITHRHGINREIVNKI